MGASDHSRQVLHCNVARRGVGPAVGLAVAAAGALLLCAGGCGRGPRILPEGQRVAIDRSLVEYPAGTELQPFIRGLNSPSAMDFDVERNVLLVAESGAADQEPRILAFDLAEGGSTVVYPYRRRLPFGIGDQFRLYGPVGDIEVHDGRIYVSHRDENDFGVITALDYEGGHTTVVAGLPARGDYGVTDLEFGPDGRLYFGVGSATNSGVVGMDNWAAGWVREHPRVADVPFVNLALRGLRINSPNPRAGLFAGDLAVTSPYQPFDVSNRTNVPAAPDGKPNAAIYSITPTGGIASDLRVEAHGIRLPSGLAFNESEFLYVTNRGMEMRGSRPVRDDPDVVLRMPLGQVWLGWPDYSADLRPVTEDRFQPPRELLAGTGYPDRLRLVIDLEESDLESPESREGMVRGVFPSLSGAGKLTFVPSTAGADEGDDNGGGGENAFARFRGDAIVPLSGDRAPFATSGRPLKGPVGFKVMRVDVDSRQVREFIRNTAGAPASRQGKGGADDPNLLERPVETEFGPDGALYVLDFGELQIRNGRERVTRGTGKVLRLAPAATEADQEGPAVEDSAE